MPFFNIKKAALKILVWCALLLLFTAVASLLHPNLSTERFTMVIVDNYYTMIGKSSFGKHLVFDGLQDNVSSIAAHFPKAALAGIYAPLFSGWNVFALITSIENIILLVLSILATSQLPIALRSKHVHLILGGLVYSLVEAGLLAISTPIYGTLVRYKVGFLPFFVFLILMKNPILNVFGDRKR